MHNILACPDCLYCPDCPDCNYNSDLPGFPDHHGKSDNWPMMSLPTNVLNDSFLCYQDLPEHVGLENIGRGFHG